MDKKTIDNIALEIANNLGGSGNDTNIPNIKKVLEKHLKTPKFSDDINGLNEKISYLNGKIEPFKSEVSLCRKKITKLRNLETKKFLTNLPDDIKDYNNEQLKWLLYHWHDETTNDYQAKSVIFGKNNLYTTCINGGKECDNIRQYKFLITVNRFDDVISFYKKVKCLLKPFPSPKNINLNIISFSFHGIYKNWGDYATEIELNKETNKMRFINLYSKRDDTTKWYTFSEMKKLVERYSS